MTWNYRGMRFKGELAIYEVYYNEADKVCGYSEKPMSPRGESLEDLQEDLLRQKHEMTQFWIMNVETLLNDSIREFKTYTARVVNDSIF